MPLANRLRDVSSVYNIGEFSGSGKAVATNNVWSFTGYGGGGFPSDASYGARTNQVAMDMSPNVKRVYACGMASDTDGLGNEFQFRDSVAWISGYDEDGLLFEKFFEKTNSSGVSSMAAGVVQGIPFFYIHGYLVRTDPLTGETVWWHQIDNGNNNIRFQTDETYIYITGQFGMADATKLDIDGNFIWSRTTPAGSQLGDVTVTPTGIYVYYDKDIVHKWDLNGNFIWGKKVTPSAGVLSITGINFDGTRIWVSGQVLDGGLYTAVAVAFDSTFTTQDVSIQKQYTAQNTFGQRMKGVERVGDEYCIVGEYNQLADNASHQVVIWNMDLTGTVNFQKRIDYGLDTKIQHFDSDGENIIVTTQGLAASGGTSNQYMQSYAIINGDGFNSLGDSIAPPLSWSVLLDEAGWTDGSYTFTTANEVGEESIDSALSYEITLNQESEWMDPTSEVTFTSTVAGF